MLDNRVLPNDGTGSSPLSPWLVAMGSAIEQNNLIALPSVSANLPHLEQKNWPFWAFGSFITRRRLTLLGAK